jgi:pimeloyl-ACP methyl ester carboxylesterase
LNSGTTARGDRCLLLMLTSIPFRFTIRRQIRLITDTLSANAVKHADRSIQEFVRVARANPAGTVGTLLEENPMWSRRDAENSVKNRLMLDVVRVARLLRTDRWNLQTLVQDCPVPVRLLAATDDSALTDPDRSVLMNRLPPDHIAVLESGHTIHCERPALWLHHVLRFAESP